MRQVNTHARVGRIKVFLLTSLLVLGIMAPAIGNTNAPSITATARHSKVCKNTTPHRAVTGKWTSFPGCGPYSLHGPRSLFFAQLHLTCTKRPTWVKIRFARVHKDGSLDTTGTTTWVLGKNAPKVWQGATWWESITIHPIKAQYKVSPGAKCVTPQRQFKYWKP